MKTYNNMIGSKELQNNLQIPVRCLGGAWSQDFKNMFRNLKPLSKAVDET